MNTLTIPTNKDRPLNYNTVSCLYLLRIIRIRIHIANGKTRLTDTDELSTFKCLLLKHL